MAEFSDRQYIVDAYRIIRPTFVNFATRVETLLRDVCDASSLHVVSSRAKTEESFAQKANRRRNSDNAYFYADPLAEIEDFAGVRAICFTDSQVNEVSQNVRDNFFVTEEIDRAKQLVAAGQVGYVSKHFIV